MKLVCEQCGNWTVMKAYQPKVGDTALATLGPDEQPNEKIEVRIMGHDGRDGWICKDEDNRTLIVRTRKLSKP